MKVPNPARTSTFSLLWPSLFLLSWSLLTDTESLTSCHRLGTAAPRQLRIAVTTRPNEPVCVTGRAALTVSSYSTEFTCVSRPARRYPIASALEAKGCQKGCTALAT